MRHGVGEGREGYGGGKWDGGRQKERQGENETEIRWGESACGGSGGGESAALFWAFSLIE